MRTTPAGGRAAPAAETRARSAPARTQAWTAHLPVVGVLLVAGVIHVLGWRAITPAWPFLGDTIDYLQAAVQFHPLHPATLLPGRWRPSGYSVLELWPLLPLHSFAAVTLVQHASTFAIGLAVYTALVRFQMRAGLAALLIAPGLLDGYTLATDQMLISESLFTFEVAVAAVLLVIPRVSPGTGALLAGTSGVLLGAATITRTVGLPLGVLALVYLLVLVRRPVAVALFTIGFALLVAPYVLSVHQTYGRYDLTATSGIFLYGRSTEFVDCARFHSTDPRVTKLCPKEPPGQRNVVFYVFDYQSPITSLGKDQNALAGQFGTTAMAEQPDLFALLVARDFWRSLGWDDPPVATLTQYRLDEPRTPEFVAAAREYEGHDPGPYYHQPLVDWMTAYQRRIWVPGAGTCIALLLGLLALAGHPLRRLRHQEGQALALLVGLTAVVFALPIISVGANIRYGVPAIPLAELTGGLAGLLLYYRK